MKTSISKNFTSHCPENVHIVFYFSKTKTRKLLICTAKWKSVITTYLNRGCKLYVCGWNSSVTIQMKAIVLYIHFILLIMLYKVVPTFKCAYNESVWHTFSSTFIGQFIVVLFIGEAQKQIRSLFSKYEFLRGNYILLFNSVITLSICAISLWRLNILTHLFSFHSYSKRTRFVDWKWKVALEWCCTSLYCSTWLKNSFDPA